MCKFSGIQLLVIVVYNYNWSMRLTVKELDSAQLATRNSVEAFFGSFLYLLGYTSSIYHLLFIGMQRIYAIRKPLLYRQQTKATVYYWLLLVWMFSLTTASITGETYLNFNKSEFKFEFSYLIFSSLSSAKILSFSNSRVGEQKHLVNFSGYSNCSLFACMLFF